MSMTVMEIGLAGRSNGWRASRMICVPGGEQAVPRSGLSCPLRMSSCPISGTPYIPNHVLSGGVVNGVPVAS